MFTKEQIEQFYRDVDGLDLKFPVSVISEKTGYSKGNVSSYLSRKLEPSEGFIKAFYKSFKIVPRATIVEEPKASYLKTRQAIKNGESKGIPIYEAAPVTLSNITSYHDETALTFVGHSDTNPAPSELIYISFEYSSYSHWCNGAVLVQKVRQKIA